jgi:alcohol dehydrogenase (cytochrome c)
MKETTILRGVLSAGLKKAALLCTLLGLAGLAGAQSLDDLKRDGNGGSTDNVLTFGMGYHQNRHSALKQINTSTVKKLVPVWSASLNNDLGEQAQPMVYDGVLYVPTVKATFAIDIASGRQLWTTPVDYVPEVPRVVCCGMIVKGIALYNGKVFRGTIDAHVVALDMKTGKQVWKQKAAEWKEGYSMTNAPQIANGVVVTGISGGEFGIRGFIDGWDPETGKHLWRTHTTAAPGEPGGDTWPAGTDHYLRGGAGTWMTGSYDPELDLVYWGTGNAGPWNSTVRPGDNLYVASVIAVRPKTGQIVWHYQWTPGDMYDYDGINENILGEIKIEGQMRKVLMHADRNGFLYVLDRANGKLLAANAFARVNWADGVDLKSGRPIPSAVTKNLQAGQHIDIWPSYRGGKNWPPMAFNPATGLLYANTINQSMEYWFDAPPEFKQGQRYTGIGFKFRDPANGEAWGFMEAIDPMTAKTKWKIPLTDFNQWSGMLSTAGGILFTGKRTGELLAIDDQTGKVLWQFKTSSGIHSMPITYTYKGRQYVTVVNGLGGNSGINSPAVREFTSPGASVWTFALMNE